jgi:hypothetical protein
MKQSIFALSALALVLSTSATAEDQQKFDEKYFTIAKVEMVEEPALEEAAPAANGSSVQAFDAPDLTETAVILDQVINLGQKVWKIVEANKPVVSVTEVPRANALPKGAESWQQLAGWQNPRARVFRVSYKNTYGFTVVDFSFRVTYTSGGNVGGKGAYLANVSVIPANLQVAWGFTFNAGVEVANVLNAGTAQSPIAGMELLMRWQIDTVVKHERSTASYFVRGDGGFVDMTNGTQN